MITPAIVLAIALVLPACREDRGTAPPPDFPEPPDSLPPVGGPGGLDAGIWIARDSAVTLPRSGRAWGNLVRHAMRPCGHPQLNDQEDWTNVCILAKALLFAATADPAYRQDVTAALAAIAGSGPYRGRALALGRELGSYVIAADLIDLPRHDSELDETFRAKLRELLVTPLDSGPGTLIACHETRPNNWGTHCGASRIAVAAYLGDSTEIARAAHVFRGYLGDRTAYADFVYGSDLSWQCDPNRPVGINPTGCTKNGRSIDGVLPDDQRRAGRFSWPPPKTNYTWEALQGALVQAVILHRAGYPTFEWQDRALLRAYRWLHEQADYPAERDDTWQPHVVNRYYGTDFPAPPARRPGKAMGWTDWTHGRHLDPPERPREPFDRPRHH